jgi:lipase maturation factor 1
MVYDGDCRFCSLWIHRWRQSTGDRLDFLPYQDPSVAARFPEVPRGQFETAVQLLEPDGCVYGGAEAVFRALAHNPNETWLLDWYEHSPVFAHLTEWGYRRIARNRRLFSRLTGLAWGKHVDRSTYHIASEVFLRSLGIIYLIAFVSLWVQIIGLIGSDGILPMRAFIDETHLQANAQKIGLDRYHLVPTLCWLNTSDTFLKLQCAAGSMLAALVIIGVAPAPCLFLLWLIYLSLTTVGRDFLGFQWDNLLLETGLLAMFLAPLQLRPRWHRTGPPSRLVLWVLRWLLFKLMFQSGCVKLLSGDPAWRSLTALAFHYETQPLPTWIGWYAFHLPLWIQQACAAFMFGIELLVPFLIFAPRRLRQAACWALLLLQVLIFLTGNYCFFNLLTMALCLLLLDDAAFRALLPKRFCDAMLSPPLPQAISRSAQGLEAVSSPGLVGNGGGNHAGPPSPSGASPRTNPASTGILRHRRWPAQITVPLAALAVVTALMQFSTLFRLPVPWPRPVVTLYAWLAPFRSFNSYGLFAVMTTSRREIVIQGSNDGVRWLDYEFRYKPGDVKKRPGFVEPHQPRLDWQMWFAALGSYRNNPWLLPFCLELLDGSRPVTELLQRNPFPKVPPVYIRALIYEYRFTELATRRKTGVWWRRDERGIYLPPISRPKRELRREAGRV